MARIEVRHPMDAGALLSPFETQRISHWLENLSNLAAQAT